MLSLSQAFHLAVKHHQANNLREAVNLYQQIVQADPHHADALHLLGRAHHQVGRYEQAMQYLRSAIRASPTLAAAHCDLGRALRALGQMPEAVASLRLAVAYQPDNAEAHHYLGSLLHLQNNLSEAVASYQEALRLKPDYAQAYGSLGTALQMQHKLPEAVVNYRNALRLNPAYAAAHNNLGSALRDQGKLEEAVASYQQAIRLMPGDGEFHINLSNTLRNLGRISEAISSCQQALRINPKHAQAHNSLGHALEVAGWVDDAITCYKWALQLRPNYIEAHKNLARVREKQGDMDGALAGLEHALRLQPDSAIACVELAVLRRGTGDLEGAEQAARAALRLEPREASALSLLASLHRDKLSAADRATIEGLVADTNLTILDRSRLLFSLAAMNDAQGNYAQATGQLREANALTLAYRRLKGQIWDIDAHAPFIGNLIASFTPALFERVQGFGLETERPVFIIGLPRSGTTLIEQILAAHSQVFSAGELSLARQDFLAFGAPPSSANSFAALPHLQRETVRQVAQRHLDQLHGLNSTAARVVDKLPDNYVHLGLLAILFPKAKFIHCCRDLRDVAVSCWMTNFRHYQWANDPDHILFRFQNYRRIMDHWREVLPVPVLDIQYEETVADLPGVARRLLEWCDLAWEPACLAFHEGKRLVRTASVFQVREPIHSRSVGRWRHYDHDLGSLFRALEPLMNRPLIKDQHNGHATEIEHAFSVAGFRSRRKTPSG